MQRKHGILLAGALIGSLALAGAESRSVVAPKGDLKWKDAGIPGVSTAAVDGDMQKGQSHFFLKYPAGFVSPLHHHSPDHYVTTVTGNLILVMDGKDHPVPPGSFFALTGKAPHVARCEGKEDCVMLVDARGPWDVVPEK
jgi:mannose-6-phosphate isomerase-like protein (cupin superfamily)